MMKKPSYWFTPVTALALLGFAFIQALELYLATPMIVTLIFLSFVTLIVAISCSVLFFTIFLDYKQIKSDRANWPPLHTS